LNLNKLRKNLAIHNNARTVVRQNSHAVTRQLLIEFLVTHVLVPQAALQASAPPRNLRRIKSRLLKLRHPHRNRAKRLQENLTTNLPPARLKVGEQTCFIASANLPHLDAGVIVIRQFLHDRAKIHTLISRKIENDPLAAERRLTFDNLDGKLVLVRRALTGIDLLPIRFLDPGILRKVRRRRLAQNPTRVER
jgi:hypothetical protein